MSPISVGFKDNFTQVARILELSFYTLAIKMYLVLNRLPVLGDKVAIIMQF